MTETKVTMQDFANLCSLDGKNWNSTLVALFFFNDPERIKVAENIIEKLLKRKEPGREIQFKDVEDLINGCKKTFPNLIDIAQVQRIKDNFDYLFNQNQQVFFNKDSKWDKVMHANFASDSKTNNNENEPIFETTQVEKVKEIYFDHLSDNLFLQARNVDKIDNLQRFSLFLLNNPKLIPDFVEQDNAAFKKKALIDYYSGRDNASKDGLERDIDARFWKVLQSERSLPKEVARAKFDTYLLSTSFNFDELQNISAHRNSNSERARGYKKRFAASRKWKNWDVSTEVGFSH